MIKTRHYSVGFAGPQRILVRTILNMDLPDQYHADMYFHISFDEFKEGMRKWNAGALIQNAFPMLSAYEREHLQTANRHSEVFAGEA